MKKFFMVTLITLSTAHTALSTVIRNLVADTVTITIQHKNGCPTEKVTLPINGSHTSQLNCIIDKITLNGPMFSFPPDRAETSAKNPSEGNPDYVSLNRTGGGHRGNPFVYTVRFE
jgi:hypothetical protein